MVQFSLPEFAAPRCCGGAGSTIRLASLVHTETRAGYPCLFYIQIIALHCEAKLVRHLKDSGVDVGCTPFICRAQGIQWMVITVSDREAAVSVLDKM